jgi:uncharacterized membrane-anchored protein
MVKRDREARETVAALERLHPDEAPVLFMLAVIYEQLGDRNEAFTWLEKSIAAGHPPDRIERSPSLSELRKDPRFARVIAR